MWGVSHIVAFGASMITYFALYCPILWKSLCINTYISSGWIQLKDLESSHRCVHASSLAYLPFSHEALKLC